MLSFIEIQKRLLPDLLTVMQKRYYILHYINNMQPVGRRSLAGSLGLTERVLRGEVEFLKEQKLIQISTIGMSLTSIGKETLESLSSVMREVTGINEMEKLLHKKLNISKVIIVAGDSDYSPWVKKEMGLAAANCMKTLLRGDNIIAVTGGTTMASVAEMLTPDVVDGELLFVPARGGIGEDVKNQANTICAMMADHTDSKHRVLYVPDEVSEDMYKSIIKDPHISEVLSLIKSADLLVHGIGEAITMAQRRRTSASNMSKIKEAEAVGEAFGYYFNENGKVVHKVDTIGIRLDNLPEVPNVIAVAGGSSKSKAIRAYLKKAPPSTVLITDEGAAKSLI
ncbi:sugar-binding transcriptional regulator [Niallia sp. NCCP-28]|uniref:sugar-binding transcriptional regulator n=1 Tax=Niallia sp. NCCP-28 TaxID=2934712 RepID=UPI002081F852|nr:sugar-binding domain-containing protein [Niallia sp. NCCP-28]GKU83315.1 central glycolytic genes regulator [Niallia sp. NCCP-28]